MKYRIDTNGDTELHTAALQNNITLVQSLIGKRFDPFIKNSRGELASELATDKAVKNALMEMESNALHHLILEKNCNRLKKVLSKSNINGYGGNKNPPLLDAVTFLQNDDLLAVIQTLFIQGESFAQPLDISATNSRRQNVFHCLFQFGLQDVSTKVIDCIFQIADAYEVDKAALLNAKDKDGKTPADFIAKTKLTSKTKPVLYKLKSEGMDLPESMRLTASAPDLPEVPPSPLMLQATAITPSGIRHKQHTACR